MYGPETGDAGRCCRDCGLDYPGGLGRCPECGGRSGARQSPRPEFRSLRLLAELLTAALAFVAVMIMTRVTVRELGLEAGTWSRGYAVTQIDKITDVTVLGLGIVFVVWFHRARVNAEHRGWAQRRAAAWTFWAWLVPIANVFVPFQLMGDIWRAGLPPGRRGTTAWLPAAWWTSFLLSGLTIRPAAATSKRYFMPHLSAGTPTFSMCMLAISAVTLIAVIRLVSHGPVGSPHPGPLPARPARLAA